MKQCKTDLLKKVEIVGKRSVDSIDQDWDDYPNGVNYCNARNETNAVAIKKHDTNHVNEEN